MSRDTKRMVFVLQFTWGQTTKRGPSLKHFVRCRETQKGWGTLRFVVYPGSNYKTKAFAKQIYKVVRRENMANVYYSLFS